MIYLDNAATSRRKPLSVYSAWLRYSLFSGGNAGRGANKLSLSGVNTILGAQDAIAELFRVDNPSNIIFTHNATYALNMAILGSLKQGDHITVTAMDHNSVLRPAARFGDYSVAKADNTGFVTPLAMRNAIKSTTHLVASTHVSNVCGTVQPVADFGRIAHNCGALFLLDASQSAGALEIDMNKIGADIIACPGHKGLMGPMGTGVLCIKEPERVNAIIVGGTGSDSESLMQPHEMPDKFHSGTVNVPALAGLTKGVRFILREGVSNIARHEKELGSAFREALLNMGDVKVYGRGDTGICAFNLDNIPSSQVAEELGDKIILRTGYHCAPLAHKALGTDTDGAVRVSFGYFNTMGDVRKITDEIYRLTRSIV